MKKITLLLSFLVVALFVNAQVLYDETFDYATVPGPLSGQGGWVEGGGVHTVTGEGRTIVNPPLAYSDGAGFWALSGLGNSFLMYDIGKVTADNYAYKPFVSTPVSTGVVYLSFLFQIPSSASSISSTNTEVFGLADGTSAGPKVMVQRLGSASPYTTFKFGTTRGAASTTAYKYNTVAPTTCTIGTVYFIVMKYDFSTQTASVFINPALTSATEPTTPEVIDNNSTTVRTQLNNLWNRNQSSWGNFYVSGVRVSTTWAAAVALPATPLSVPQNVTATTPTNNGVTVNWTPVANAGSYDIAVFDGITQVKALNAASQSTSSYVITGLKSNTAYTFKVIAKGDGINFASSGASSVVDFNTLGLSAPLIANPTVISDNGFIANWTAVGNAVGYDVNLYFGTLLVSTTNVIGQASASLTFSSLKAGSTYNYTVVAKGDGTVNLNSTASSSASATTTFPAVNAVSTDFGDGSWGAIIPTPTTNLPSNGMYPSGSINGFAMTSCAMYGLLSTGPYGEEHINVIRMDKSSFGASVTTPVINSVARLELHASGSDLKTFTVKQWNAGALTWDLVSVSSGLFTISGSYENVFKIDLNITAPTQLKIENGSTSSISITHIKTYTTIPTIAELPAPTGIGVAQNLIDGGFTASWTPVNNATGYLVTVLNNGTYLHKTFVVSGQGTSTCNVIGLDSASVCTYKVAAIGDGITNSNSLLSLPSTPFSIRAGLVAVEHTSVSNTIWSDGKSIFSTEVGDFEVYSLQGLKVISAKRTNQISTNLQSGLYIAKFTNQDRKVVTTKIVIH